MSWKVNKFIYWLRSVKQLYVEDRRVFKLLILYYVLALCGLALGGILALPIIGGAIGIIDNNGDIPSATASMELAVLALAFGAAFLWFAGKTKISEKTGAKRKFEDLRRRSALGLGSFVIFAAACFTLFALLAPVIPDAVNANDFISIVVKWTGIISLIAGSISIGITLCIGIFLVWVWQIGR